MLEGRRYEAGDVEVEAPPMAAVPLGLLTNAAAHGQPMAVVVWAWLQGRYGQYRAGTFPGMNRVAVELGVSRSTVKRALHWLEGAGWLTVQERLDEHGRQTTNRYVLHVRSVERPYDAAQAAAFRAHQRAVRAADLGPVENCAENGRETASVSAFAEGVTGDLGEGVTRDPQSHSLYKEELPTLRVAVESADAAVAEQALRAAYATIGARHPAERYEPDELCSTLTATRGSTSSTGRCAPALMPQEGHP
jgi:hypothetical protein